MFGTGNALLASNGIIDYALLKPVSALLGATVPGIGAASTAYGGLLTPSPTRSISSGHDIDDKLGRPTTPWVRQVISGVDLMR